MEHIRANIKKNQSMVRKSAPITIESRGYDKVSEKMKRVCNKLKENY